jgi:hypothetical protein
MTTTAAQFTARLVLAGSGSKLHFMTDRDGKGGNYLPCGSSTYGARNIVTADGATSVEAAKLLAAAANAQGIPTQRLCAKCAKSIAGRMDGTWK